LIDSSTCKNGFWKYDYEIKLILLKNLIENMLLDFIVEIWQIKLELLPTHLQFIIYLYQCERLPKLYQSEGEP
jgi:hypothetical protein